MSFASVCASVRLYHMTVEEEISSKITFYKDVVNVSHPTKKKVSMGGRTSSRMHSYSDCILCVGSHRSAADVTPHAHRTCRNTIQAES